MLRIRHVILGPTTKEGIVGDCPLRPRRPANQILALGEICGFDVLPLKPLVRVLKHRAMLDPREALHIEACTSLDDIGGGVKVVQREFLVHHLFRSGRRKEAALFRRGGLVGDVEAEGAVVWGCFRHVERYIVILMKKWKASYFLVNGKSTASE